MKRLTALVAVPVLLLGLVACDLDDDAPVTVPSTTPGATTPSGTATAEAPPTPPTAADQTAVRGAYQAYRVALAKRSLPEYRAIVHPRFGSDLVGAATPKAMLKAVADRVAARKLLLRAQPDLVLVGGDAVAAELRERFPDYYGSDFDGNAAEKAFTEAIGGSVDYVAYVVISDGARIAGTKDLIVGLARFGGAWKVVNLVT